MATSPVGRLRARAGSMKRRVRTVQASRNFESRIVWVLGSPRSGSTWLLQLLAEHDAVVPINEPLIGWYLGPFLSDLPGWSASLDVENFTLRKVQEKKPQQFFAEQFREIWLPALGEMMRKRFLAHMLRFPPRAPLSRALVVIKEPAGSQSADVIVPALPRSRLLFLLRDGRDVVDSDLAANLKGSWVGREFPGARGISDAERLDFVVQSAQKWLWRTEVVQSAYAAHSGPKKTIRYETLLEDAPGSLRELFDWLEIEASSEQISEFIERHAFSGVPEAERGPDRFFRAASPGLWRENLNADEREVLQELLGPKLYELGYETRTSPQL